MEVTLLFVRIVLGLATTTATSLSKEELIKLCESIMPIPDAKRNFYIQNIKTNLVLDIKDKSRLPDAEVIMAPMDLSSSQQWTHTENSITSVHSGLSLAVANRGRRTKNPVFMKAWDSGNDKQWFFESDGHILTVHWYQLLTQLNDNSVVAMKREDSDTQRFTRVYI